MFSWRCYFCRIGIPQAEAIERNNRAVQGQELARAGTGPQTADIGGGRIYNHGPGSLMAAEVQLRSGVEPAHLAEEQLTEVRKS